MNLEIVKNNLRYTLSNKGLKIGDRVWPLLKGRTLDNGSFNLHKVYWKDFRIDEAHVIKSYDEKTNTIHTSHGYSPAIVYYKIIKIEEQVDMSQTGDLFKQWHWRDIPITETT